MNFARICPIVVAVLYVITGAIHLSKGHVPVACMWFAYSVASVALAFVE